VKPFSLAVCRLLCVPILLTALHSRIAVGQSSPSQLAPVLSEEIQPPAISVFQMKQYLLKRAAKPPAPASAEQWTAESKRLRDRLLKEVVFHGWPQEWVNAPPRFEETGVLAGKGYRMRKLRYEIVPGFYGAAVLYEPENLQGKVPGIVNVNGHVGPPGKAVEYKQKRCIHFARQGMLALNLEWFAFGELSSKENGHWFGAHLDLVGTHHLGLFYLAMRKGLDYLYEHANADRSRLGVTGLSGGGWQTIVLSALDERVKAAVPVAGYSALAPKLEVRRYGDLGDLEQSATDLFDGQDYTHLTAMMAPRPTLIAHNTQDDCCFRAGIVKPLNFDAIRPIFKLYGKEDLLTWHENNDPGDHNYQLDNRMQAYGFFAKRFNVPMIQKEIEDLRSYEELVVGLPQNNLTILGFAKKLAQAITRPPIPSDGSAARQSWRTTERDRLKTVLRYKAASLLRPWVIATTKAKGLETKSYLFEMTDGLCANAVWVRAIGQPDDAPVTLILNDKGKSASGAEIAERVNRGEQVLALDLLFVGDAWRDGSGPSYAQILHGTGDRALSLIAAQLIEVAQWMQSRATVRNVRLECNGLRSQAAGLTAAALSPALFSDIVIHEGASSLSYLLEKPVEYREAPELFCLNLYKYFDFDILTALAAPARVTLRKAMQDVRP
jgi:dienelactone hydrolase